MITKNKLFIIYIFFFQFIPTYSFSHPIFGQFANQISISRGQSIRSGLNKEKLFYADITYSQPETFFRLSSKKNIILIGFYGEDCHNQICNKYNGYPKESNLSQYNLSLVGISKDIVLFSLGYLYMTIQLGAYIKNESTHRISSTFIFNEKFSIGYRINDFSLIIYTNHFSNGTLTDKNSGQNFYGLSIGINF